MSYAVKIIADSLAPTGARLTTFEARYPRSVVHEELGTHRSFSRSSGSTRAVPLAKQIRAIKDDPALPIWWGAAQPGMQARAEVDADAQDNAKWQVASLMFEATTTAKLLDKLGVHKQTAGRYLEAFGHISTVITSTAPGLLNFFALRCHRDAQPEIQALAVPMARAYRASVPDRLDFGDWHLPYIGPDELDKIGLKDAREVSAARVARVSYLRHDGEPSPMADDLELAEKLLDAFHMGPFEHQATPAIIPTTRSGNLVGWHQYRQTLHGNVYEGFDFSILDTVYADRDFAV